MKTNKELIALLSQEPASYNLKKIRVGHETRDRAGIVFDTSTGKFLLAPQGENYFIPLDGFLVDILRKYKNTLVLHPEGKKFFDDELFSLPPDLKKFEI
jgi:hypothetical protein